MSKSDKEYSYNGIRRCRRCRLDTIEIKVRDACYIYFSCLSVALFRRTRHAYLPYPSETKSVCRALGNGHAIPFRRFFPVRSARFCGQTASLTYPS